MFRRASRRALAVLCLCGLAPIAAVQARNPFSFFSSPTGDVVIVTDVTEAGKRFEAPTKDTPIHCLALNFGCSFGAMAGEPMPDSAEMGKLVGRLLAEQGYQGSDEANPPRLVITIQWGMIAARTGYALAFLGADKAGLIEGQGGLREFGGSPVPESAESSAAFKIRQMAEDDIYVATVCGFDYEAYMAGRAEMLWKTRIACSVTGLSLAKALPTMVTIAAPAIGRETRQVIVTNPGDVREGEVKLGELQVIDEHESDRPRK